MPEARSVVILGGGVAGLAAGWRLARTGQWRVTVVERAPVIGGLCGTFRHGDMRLDYGPHKCFSLIPGVLDELRALMGDELLRHEKRNRIYLFGRYLSYPLSLMELARSMPPGDIAATGLSAIAGRLKGLVSAGRPDSYEAYVESRFGRHLYGLVFEPLAEKVWGDPATLSADIARTRIPSAGVADIVSRLLGLKRTTEAESASHFYYPKGGFGRIPERMAEEITAAGGEVLVSTTPMAVHHEGGAVTGVSVEREGARTMLPCDLLISTLPFDALGELMLAHRRERDLEELVAAAGRLQYRHLILVYVVVGADQLTNEHWIFFPERVTAFGRICEQKLLSRAMVPDGKTVICCDLADTEAGERWRASDEALGRRCVADLQAVGILNHHPVQETFVRRVRRFYPRYDLAYREVLSVLYARIRRYRNLLSTGRIGFYNYNNSDHCVDMAVCIEQGLAAGDPAPAIMERLEQRVRDYRIVD